MAKVGDQAHTDHGLGTITESMIERGRVSYRVAGRGFSVWVDETKLHVASDGGEQGLFSYGPMMNWAEQARNTPQYGWGGGGGSGESQYDPRTQQSAEDSVEHFGGLESTIVPGEPYHVQDNSTTLPYSWKPQNPVNVFDQEQTILPGEFEVDADDRLHPSDSVSGTSKSLSRPGPDSKLFAGGGGDHPFDHTASMHQGFDGFVGDHQHHDPMYNQGESHGVSPLGNPDDVPDWERGAFNAITGPGRGIAQGVDWLGGHLPHRHHGSAHPTHHEDHQGDWYADTQGGDEDYSERDAGRHSWEPEDEHWQGGIHNVTMGDDEYKSYGQHGSDVGEDKYSGGKHETFVEGAYRPAGLSDKYAYVMHDAELTTPVAQFRNDPVGFIRTCGHLWTDGDESLERFAAYTDLVDDEAQRLGGIQHTAAWKDVAQKAQRLRHEGKIAVSDAGKNRIFATVEGDNGTYDVMVYKAGAFGGNQTVLDWACSCDWGRWAFKRKFSMVGRLCSHAYGAYLHMQSDHFKKHPIGKSAASTENYKTWLKDNHQSPEAASIANYLNTQGNDATDDQVRQLYDYASDNPQESRERDFKIPYTNEPDTAYKTADALLRTKPMSLTPNLQEVPEGDGQQWMDLEKDERETTGPDQIVHFSKILRELHGVSTGITDFGTEVGGNVMGTTDSEASAAGTGGNSLPDSSTSSEPDSSSGGGMSDTSTAETSGGGIGGDFGSSGEQSAVQDHINDQASAMYPGSDDVSQANQGAASSAMDKGYGLASVRQAADVLEQIRALEPAYDSNGHMDERNDHVRDLVDKAQNEGYDATQFVAAQNPNIPSDGDPNFLGQSSPGWADQGFAGSGPDPKDWFSDSAGYVRENEVPHHETEWFEHPDDDIIKYNDSRSKPQQGPRSAANTGNGSDGDGSNANPSYPGTSTIDNDYSSHDTPPGLGGYEYGLGGHFSSNHYSDVNASDAGGGGTGNILGPGEGLGGEAMDSPDESFGDVTASLHLAGDEDDEVWHGDDQGSDSGNYSGGGSATYAAHDPEYHRNGYPRDDAEDELFPADLSSANGLPVEQDREGEAYPSRNVHHAADAMDVGYFDPQGPNDSDWEQGSGDDFMNAVGDEASQVTNPMQGMPDGGGKAAEGEAGGAAAGEGALAEMPMVIAQRHGFDVQAFDRGELAPSGGELRRAGRVGGGPKSQVRIDPGSRDGRLPGQPSPRQHTAAPEDFGFDGVDESRYAALDDGSAADIVANFQRAGAAGLMSNEPVRSGGSDDFASSPLVQKFLRTAGRVYPEDEQRRLEGEFHPQGARNMPTEDDLAGTHYLL